jgi:pimeloyl-ACP methyl ester carboxylesterase
MRVLFAFFFSIGLAFGQPPTIVIGFVGGFVRHDNFVHSVVQLAAHLREDYREIVYAQVFENRHRENAHGQILRLLDANHDGNLSVEEKQNARIIVYGHSWGASETVTLARELERDGIPVLLTIQVDSVKKIGQEDSVIPANVARAANFYQPRGLLRGRSAIRAADAARTRIIGNFRSDYKTRRIRCDGYPRFARVLTKPHIEIECDPSVWSQVESLIRSELPVTGDPAR